MALSEYNKGAAHARDLVLCLIIGIQNEIIWKPESPEYQAYQKLYEEIVDRYGDMYAPFKG